MRRQQHLLVPLVRVTRVLPGLRTWKMEGALMSYHSLRVMGSTLQWGALHRQIKDKKKVRRGVVQGDATQAFSSALPTYPVNSVIVAVLIPKKAATLTSIVRNLRRGSCVQIASSRTAVSYAKACLRQQSRVFFRLSRQHQCRRACPGRVWISARRCVCLLEVAAKRMKADQTILYTASLCKPGHIRNRICDTRHTDCCV